MITGLQIELDEISDSIDCASPISFGNTPGISQQIALYEEPPSSGNNGTYFYGFRLVMNQAVGMGMWAGTGNAFPEQSTDSGRQLDMLITATCRVGVNQQNPTYTLDGTGDIKATGTIIGATESFHIQHADHDRKDTHRLRYWCVEADVVSGLVMYRKRITTTKSTTITSEIPDWFKHLIENATILCDPYKRFGNVLGKFKDNNTFGIHTSKGGAYNIFIICGRAEYCSQNNCPQEVEYIY